ncbi:MAG: hypothetical protein WDN24_01345 [Sphingomonas sp.]
MANALAEDSNDLRLIALVNPAHLNQNGSRSAVELRLMLAHLRERTSSFWGHGYLAPARVDDLPEVHLTDNVSAVHVMTPFGRVGAFALLAVLLAAAGALSSELLTRKRSWPEMTALLAIWTMFGTALYMTLANLQLVPFTGRNIYFLAATSGSDLLEGLLLLVLVQWGLSARRKAAA